MPGENLIDPANAQETSDGTAPSATRAAPAVAVAQRLGHGPYYSDDPLHRAAVDANALRCELYALADNVPDLRGVARILDAAADALDEHATAAGL